MLVSDRSTFIQNLQEAKLGSGIRLNRTSYILKSDGGYNMRIVVPDTIIINRFWRQGEEGKLAWFLENWEVANAS
jgi:hypothetical protein